MEKLTLQVNNDAAGSRVDAWLAANLEHTSRSAAQRLLEEGGAEMRARWARASALIQTAYVIQAIRAVGLAAGPMNGDDAEALATEFFAGQDVEVLLVINVGHPGPDAYQERNPRLPFEEVYQVL